MSEMENDNEGESESETELGLPLFRPFTRSNYSEGNMVGPIYKRIKFVLMGCCQKCEPHRIQHLKFGGIDQTEEEE